MAYSLGQQVYQILARVMEHEIAKSHFNDPVDVEGLGIPEYLDIIKEPIDLGTIRARLVQGHYRHPSEVYGDVHLVWHNCRTYNEPNSDIVAQCNVLATHFEGMWRKLDFGAQQQASGPTDGNSADDPQAPHQLSFRHQAQQFKGEGGESEATVAASLSPRTSQQIHSTGRHKPPQVAAVAAATVHRGPSGHPLKRCLGVVEQLVALPHAERFREGVDPSSLGLPDYLQQPARPSGLVAIRDQLAPGLENGWGTIQYKSTVEVLEDVRHVLNTCRVNSISEEHRAQCDAVEKDFLHLWLEAGLPPEQGSPPGSGAGATPKSPLSLPSQGAPMPGGQGAGAGGALGQLPPAKGKKRSASVRSVAELSSGGVAAHSADISAAAAQATAAAAAAAPKRHKKGGSSGSVAKATSTRCDVCVRCKKGRCGSDTAPKNCRKRVARALAAAQAAQAAAAAGATAQAAAVAAVHETSLGAAHSLGLTGVEHSEHGEGTVLGTGANSQHTEHTTHGAISTEDLHAEPAAAAGAAEASAGAGGGTGAPAVGGPRLLRRATRTTASRDPPSTGGDGGALTPTSAAAAAFAAGAQLGQGIEAAQQQAAELGCVLEGSMSFGSIAPVGGPAAAGKQVAAHQGGKGGGKGARTKGLSSPAGQQLPSSQEGLQREREVLAAWGRLQKKVEQAAEAASTAQEAAQSLCDAREVLEAIELLEQEEEHMQGSEQTTPWPPGATYVPASYDVAAANAAVMQRRVLPLLQLGARWLSQGGPMGVAVAAAAAAATTAQGRGPTAEAAGHDNKDDIGSGGPRQGEPVTGAAHGSTSSTAAAAAAAAAARPAASLVNGQSGQLEGRLELLARAHDAKHKLQQLFDQGGLPALHRLVNGK